MSADPVVCRNRFGNGLEHDPLPSEFLKTAVGFRCKYGGFYAYELVHISYLRFQQKFRQKRVCRYSLDAVERSWMIRLE